MMAMWLTQANKWKEFSEELVSGEGNNSVTVLQEFVAGGEIQAICKQLKLCEA